MSYTITYQADMHILEVVFSGEVDINEVKAMFAETVERASLHNCFLVLENLLEANFKLSISEIFSLPAHYARIMEPLNYSPSTLKRAFVVDKSSFRRIFKFLEDVTVNRGHAVRIFVDEAEARAWLTTREVNPA